MYMLTVTYYTKTNCVTSEIKECDDGDTITTQFTIGGYYYKIIETYASLKYAKKECDTLHKMTCNDWNEYAHRISQNVFIWRV